MKRGRLTASSYEVPPKAPPKVPRSLRGALSGALFAGSCPAEAGRPPSLYARLAGDSRSCRGPARLLTG